MPLIDLYADEDQKKTLPLDLYDDAQAGDAYPLKQPLDLYADETPDEGILSKGISTVKTVAQNALPLLGKGFISLPETAAGLYDIARIPQNMVEKGIDTVARKVLPETMENVPEYQAPSMGKLIEPVLAEPKRYYEEALTPEYKAGLEDYNQSKGAWEKVKAVGRNPFIATGTIIESLPASMIPSGIGGRIAASGLLTRALSKAGIKTGTQVAKDFAVNFFKNPKTIAQLTGIGGAIEGAIVTGQQQTQYEQGGMGALEAAKYSIPAGVSTAIISILSSKIPGFKDSDAEALLASAGNSATRKTMLEAGKGVAKTMFKEAYLEEWPQSVQEKIWQNLAEKKPWNEGLDDATVMGIISGMGQGGGMALGAAGIDYATTSKPIDILKPTGNKPPEIKPAETPVNGPVDILKPDIVGPRPGTFGYREQSDIETGRQGIDTNIPGIAALSNKPADESALPLSRAGREFEAKQRGIAYKDKITRQSPQGQSELNRYYAMQDPYLVELAARMMSGENLDLQGMDENDIRQLGFIVGPDIMNTPKEGEAVPVPVRESRGIAVSAPPTIPEIMKPVALLPSEQLKLAPPEPGILPPPPIDIGPEGPGQFAPTRRGPIVQGTGPIIQAGELSKGDNPSDYTGLELRQIAKDRGYEIPPSMIKKTDMIEFIKANKPAPKAPVKEVAKSEVSETPIKVQRSSQEDGENTMYEIVEGPQKGSSLSRGALTQDPSKYAVDESLMPSVAQKANVNINDAMAKELEKAQARKAVKKESEDLTVGKLNKQVVQYTGTGGIASEARKANFLPAFRDNETGKVYPSLQEFSGKPSGVHDIGGLPAELVTKKNEYGDVTEVKGTIEAGFTKDGKFYTREEAVKSQQPKPPLPTEPTTEQGQESGFNPLQMLTENQEPAKGKQPQIRNREIDNLINGIDAEINDWKSRKYKDNKKQVSSGGTFDDLNADSISINKANENRRQRNIQSLERAKQEIIDAKNRINNGESPEKVYGGLLDSTYTKVSEFAEKQLRTTEQGKLTEKPSTEPAKEGKPKEAWEMDQEEYREALGKLWEKVGNNDVYVNDPFYRYGENISHDMFNKSMNAGDRTTDQKHYRVIAKALSEGKLSYEEAEKLGHFKTYPDLQPAPAEKGEGKKSIGREEEAPYEIYEKDSNPSYDELTREEISKLFRGKYTDALIIKSPKNPKQWQVSSFDKKGIPNGDTQTKTYEEAVKEAINVSGISTLEDINAVKELEGVSDNEIERITNKLLDWKKGERLTDPDGFRNAWTGYSEEKQKSIIKTLVDKGELPVSYSRRKIDGVKNTVTATELLDGLTRTQSLDKFKPKQAEEKPAAQEKNTKRISEIKAELETLQSQYEKRSAKFLKSSMVPPSIKSGSLKSITDRMDKLDAELGKLEKGETESTKPKEIVRTLTEKELEELRQFKKDDAIEQSEPKAKPGKVFLEKGGVKPFFEYKEITRGKVLNKGKYKVTLTNGKTVIVNKEAIREFPSAQEDTGNKPVFLKEAIGDIDTIEKSLKKRGVRGDNLLDAMDRVTESLDYDNALEIDSDGQVTLYHRTNKESAKKINETGVMTPKEQGLFFGSKPEGQIEGYGDSIVKVKIPIEKLELNDIFTDEVHFRVPDAKLGRPYRVKIIKDTDATFSKDLTPTGKTLLSKQGVENIIKGVKTKLPNIGNFEVVKTQDELPEFLFKEQERDDSRIYGVYDPQSDTFYLVADNMKNRDAVLNTVIHEAIGHRGVDAIIPKSRRKQLFRMVNFEYGKKDIGQKIIKDYKLDMTNETDQVTFAREVIAHMAVNEPKASLLDRVISMIKSALREIGITLKISDAEIRSLLARSYKFAQTGKGKAGNEGLSYSQRPIADKWFSALEKGVENLKQEKATPEQWLGMIKKLAVKEEEMSWVGLEPWLKEQKGTVTKQAILDFISMNNVQIEEVEKGSNVDKAKYIEEIESDIEEYGDYEFKSGKKLVPNEDGGVDYVEDLGYLIRSYSSISDAVSSLSGTEIHMDQNVGTKYSQYQLPGGENYRELLITMPEAESALLLKGERERIQKRIDEIQNIQSENPFSIELDREEETLFNQLNNKWDERNKINYKSSHWDEPNVMGHIRFNDRTGANGEKILFIEEIQSDWGQEGRKKGYKGDKEPKVKQFGISFGGNEPSLFFNTREEAQARIDQIQNDITEPLSIKEIERVARSGAKTEGVPDMPFKKSWPLTMFKRMVRYATENGYDSIAWTPGDVQADRYDLSKQVDKIEVEKVEDVKNLFFVDIFTSNGNNINLEVENGVIRDGEFKNKSLDDVIGKDLAEKILTGESQIIKEGDLKVGGEGMKGFYDKILPAEVNKFFNKPAWGNPKVGTTKIGASVFYPYETMVGDYAIKNSKGEYYRSTNEGPNYYEFGSDEEADIFPDKETALEVIDMTLDATGKVKPQEVWSIPITPEMRDKALTEGMPMFEKGNITDTKEFKDFFGDSKVVDENGKPLVVYHGTPEGSIDIFDRSKLRRGTGFHFTISKKVSAQYGNSIIPVYLKIENPLKMYMKSGIAEWDSALKYSRKNNLKVVDVLKERGYDGIFDGNILRGGEIQVFDSEQIKSIYNKGSFDKTDKRIMFSLSSEEKKKLDTIFDDYDTTIDTITKPSKLAERVQEESEEDNIPGEFESLVEYETRPEFMKDQKAKAAKLLKSDYELAKKIAMGESEPPIDIRWASVYNAVKKQALSDRDYDLLYNLGTVSNVPTILSEFGQQVKAADETDPDDPLKAMRDIEKDRKEKNKKQGKKVVSIEKVKELKKQLAEAEEKLKKYEGQTSEENAEVEVDNLIKKSPKRLIKKTNSKILKEQIQTSVDNKNELSDIAMDIQELAKYFITQGVVTREPLVKAVHGVIKDIIPGITIRETQDAISGYGKFKPLSKDEVLIKLRDLKGQMQQVSKLEDMQQGRAPLKTGIERRTPTDEERRLIKQVEEMKKELGIEVIDPEKQLKSALDSVKTRLENQIRDLEFQIESGEKIVKKKTGLKYDVIAERLKKRRDELKKEYDNLFGKPGISDEQRIQMAINAVNKSIVEYTRKINENDLTPLAKRTPLQSKELDTLKAERDKLKAKIKELRDLAKPKRTPEEIATQRLKTRLTNETQKLTDKLKKLDLQKAEKRETVLDAQGRNLKAKRDAIKEAYNAAVEASGVVTREESDRLLDLAEEMERARDEMEKGGDRLKYGVAKDLFKRYIDELKGSNKSVKSMLQGEVKEIKTIWKENKVKAPFVAVKDILETISDIAVSLNATWDNSFIGRQGRHTLMTHPSVWGPAAMKSFVDIYDTLKSKHGSQSVRSALMADVYSSENYLNGDYTTAKLITKQEEETPSSLPGRIPVIGRTFKASDNAFHGAALRMRLKTYDLLKRIAELQGVNTKDKLWVQETGKLINSVTARGDLGRMGDAKLLRLVLWAPKMMMGHINVLTAHFGGATLKHPFARQQARKNLAKIVGLTVLAAAIIDGVGRAFGKDDLIEWNPLSSDFMKIKIGDTRYDLTAGTGAYVILAARTIATVLGFKAIKNTKTGKMEYLNSGKWGSKTLLDVIEDFLINKTAPGAGAIIDKARGRNFEFEKPTFKNTAYDLTIPIGIKNFIKAYGREDTPKAEELVGNILDIVGVNANTYDSDKEMKKKYKALRKKED